MFASRLNEKFAAEYRRKGYWVGQTLIEYAIEAVERDPSAQVFLGEEREVDMATLLLEAEALAVSLWEMGLRPGDVVAFQLPNWVEGAVINLAACRIGLICNPLVPIYRDAELAFMLNASESKVVFIPTTFRSFDFMEMYDRMRRGLMHHPTIVTVRGTQRGGIHYESLIEAGLGRSIEWPLVTPESVKLLLYTSGTTGHPKGVLHSHDTLARAIRVSVAHWGVNPGDVILMPSPITHATGYANALELPFLHRTRTVLMDRWDARQAVELIDKYSVTATVGATPFLKELTAAAAAAKSELKSLRVFACGGASVPPEVISDANRKFANQPAFRVYGSSEAPYTTLGQSATQTADAAAFTDGCVVDYEVKIVDDVGNDQPAGVAGEIIVRGPSLFLGYADVADNHDCFTAEGYFRTGDIGMMSPESWITITGRKKDLIIRGGENISAKEIEDALHGYPPIMETAVVSMPHDRLGEGVFAFVIARDGQEPTFDGVLEYLKDSGLSRHKYPERLAILKDFPRTASGKIKKDILRLMAADVIKHGSLQAKN